MAEGAVVVGVGAAMVAAGEAAEVVGRAGFAQRAVGRGLAEQYGFDVGFEGVFGDGDGQITTLSAVKRMPISRQN